MPNKLVVCSNPEGDDYVGEEYNADYCNIVEYDWQELKQKIQKYPEVILKHNGKNKNIFRILTYHSIGDDVPEDVNGLYNLSEDKFYKQMKYLYDNNYNVCSLDNIQKN